MFKWIIATIGLVSLFAFSACGGSSSSSGGISVSNGNSEIILQTEFVVATASKNYYQVFGSTYDELLSELNRKGPGQFFGQTKTNRTYQINFSGSCVITGVKVTNHSVITLPRWEPAFASSVDLANRWNRFVNALELHELEHSNLDAKESVRFASEVLALGPMSSCSNLEKAISNLNDVSLSRAETISNDYDSRTNHGKTEGAVF